MKIKSRSSKVQATVDMTPMLDVVFQLIIFFLVSTTFAILPAIKLNLPQSATSEGATNKGITITASDDGKLFFNEKEVTIDSLGEELVMYDTGDTKKVEFPVSLEADSEVTNGQIVSIFDVIRLSGYSVINLRTTSKK